MLVISRIVCLLAPDVMAIATAAAGPAGIIQVPQALQIYSINMTIGTAPVVQVNVLLDAGNGAMGIPSKNCTSTNSCTIPAGLEVYDPSIEPSAIIFDNATEPGCVYFHDGGHCGWRVNDIVGVGGWQHDMTFKANFDFPHQQLDFMRLGNFGVGPGTPPGLLSLPEAMFASGSTGNPTVSFYVDPDTTYSQPVTSTFDDAGQSWVAFGAAPPAGDVTIPALQESDGDYDYWNLVIDSIGNTKSIAAKTIFDTGNPYLTFSSNLAQIVYAEIGLTDAQIKQCKENRLGCLPPRHANDTFPVTFRGSSAAFQVPVANKASCSPTGCTPAFSPSDAATYVDSDSSLTSGNAAFGVPFLRNYIVTFGFAGHTISLDSISNTAAYSATNSNAASQANVSSSAPPSFQILSLAISFVAVFSQQSLRRLFRRFL